jgi:O-methyltransferase domain
MPLPPFPVPLALLRAVLSGRQRLLDAVDLVVPVEAALWDYTNGLQRTKLAGALVTSGLADALGDRWRTPSQLADELGLEQDATARLLGAAAASRLLRFDARRGVRLSRLGRPLRRDHPRTLASWAAYLAAPTTGRAYEELAAQVHSGSEPSGHRRAFGDSIWEYFGAHPDEGARFGAAMRELTAIDTGALALAYPWPRRGVVCDVAGGIGSLLGAILRRRSHSRGVLIDSPEIAEQGREYLASIGVGGRVQIVVGDLFGELRAQADVYVLKWILHDWSDAACRDILQRVRATMGSGSRIVCIDQHLDRDRPSPISSMVDLHMMVECEGGRERSPTEVHELMRSVGLRAGRVRHSGLHMLVEGIA